MKRDKLEQSLQQQQVPGPDQVFGPLARTSAPPRRKPIEGLIPRGEGVFEYKRFRITPVGMDIPEDVSQEEWLDVGRVIWDVYSSISWVVGDWANHANRVWGVSYDSIAQEFGYEVETLWTYAGVVRAFPTSIRNRGVSFAHHRLVIKLPVDEQVKWLAAAAERGWTLSQMREAINPKRPALPNGKDPVSRFQKLFTPFQQRLHRAIRKAGQGDRRQIADWLREEADRIERGD